MICTIYNASLFYFIFLGCGHCKRMKPDFSRAAKELKTDGAKSRLAILDCTVEKSTAEKYQINGYPTLKLFRAGKFVADYDGERTVIDIKKYVKNLPVFTKDEL